MENFLKKRKTELKREANVNSIEAEIIRMEISESKNFKLIDIQALQRIKVRIRRLKPDLEFSASNDGNHLTITRLK